MSRSRLRVARQIGVYDGAARRATKKRMAPPEGPCSWRAFPMSDVPHKPFSLGRDTVERRHDGSGCQELRQRLACGVARAIGDVHRYSEPAEALDEVRDDGVGPTPVGAHQNRVRSRQARPHRDGLQGGQLVDLAGETPAGRHIDQHGLAFGDEPVERRRVERDAIVDARRSS